ncbi:LytS/YhcK type 5TM receptor domain-containing protein [Desulfuromonas acetexigens]|nr:LytS/YhcK type 5TM receptor domain-containing protein [Desulfuromonas acetexigens]
MLPILIELTYNLALLVALSTVSGFIGDRFPGRGGALLQGLLFGAAAVIGMLNPLILAPGLIFDGRSVMISLGGLFFGPLTAAISTAMAMALRIAQGGTGMPMGVSVIVVSALLGWAFHRRAQGRKLEITTPRLLLFGLTVHVAMLLCAFTLPSSVALDVIKHIGPPVLLVYPLATVLIGKILSDNLGRARFLAALTKSEAQLKEAQALAHLGSWELVPPGNRLHWSDETWRILGLTPRNEPADYQRFLERVHPEDREQVDRAYRESLRDERDIYEIEHRVVRPSGEIRQVLERCGHERDASGRVLRSLGMILDVTELKTAEEHLRRVSEELRQRNEELERFIYSVSHDLKSPLVTFKTFLGFLRQDHRAGSRENMEKDMDFMAGAAAKMERLLEDLLEMSRIGRLDKAPTRIELGELVEAALATVAGPIAERGVEVRSELPELCLYGDRLRLERLWQNLIDNAVKYLGEQAAPRVEIGVEKMVGETIFFVRDNGLGIDPYHQRKVFGLFEKIDAKSPGSGLGLALAKRIVELYHGRIWVESAGPGRGACFRFTLPDALREPEEFRS